MQLKWTGANVVLLAQSHNPSILSPAWIQQNHIIEESPENFVHTPVFSLYQSGTFQLMVEQERFQLTLRVLSEVNLQALQEAASRYIRTLPHVPYKAVGLNFTWLATVERPEEVEQQIFPESEKLRSAFPEGEIKTGTFLYNIVQGYRLRLLVEPRLQTKGDLGLDFNYHFDVTSAEEALKALSRLPASFSGAEQASRRLFGTI
jgi:hypothetical protein